jgi:hypothetical protein
METDPISETLYSFVFFRNRTMDKVQKPSTPEFSILVAPSVTRRLCGCAFANTAVCKYLQSFRKLFLNPKVVH